ncbi:MAG TPA: ribose-5-phosphate isomerase RpiA [Spirochaetia bacterium]|nr:ribose-5-phosphate isomerase RpiA [Spirochaetia bacterium]
MADLTDLKKKLGTYAADHFVRDGMKVGLGTGSTAIWAARRVAQRLSSGELRGIRTVVTSLQTELEARALGIPVFTLNDAALESSLDIVIDGADEVDPAGNLIKGGGGALLMEKIIAYSSKALVIIVDHTKLSPRLCEHFAIPVEVVADAVTPVRRTLEKMGGEVSLRMAVMKAGPVVTDLGNLLLDVTFRGEFDPRRMEEDLKLIPGVLEDGLFTRLPPALVIAREDGTIQVGGAPLA